MSLSSGAPSPACCTGLTGVVPCFNAGPRVRPVVEGTVPQVEHLIVVNDGSTDGCIETLEGLPARVISFTHNRGKGHALLEGLRAALEDPDMTAVCCLDADGQHDPAEIPRLYSAFRERNADLVIGARTFGGGGVPWRSRVGNQVTATVTAWLLGARLPDTQSGFRLLSRRFAQTVLDTVPGGRYETEMEIIVKALRTKCPIESVPIATIYEEANRSSHFRKLSDSFRIYARLLRSLLR
jgi:glycosyltransferase involved in cell wall biosynthesis